VSFVGVVENILPTFALPAGFLAAIVLIVGYLNEFSFLFPMQTLFDVVGIYVFFHVVLLTWDFGLWIIHLIRGR